MSISTDEPNAQYVSTTHNVQCCCMFLGYGAPSESTITSNPSWPRKSILALTSSLAICK